LSQEVSTVILKVVKVLCFHALCADSEGLRRPLELSMSADLDARRSLRGRRRCGRSHQRKATKQYRKKSLYYVYY
jgi:hypothetical protein